MATVRARRTIAPSIASVATSSAAPARGVERRPITPRLTSAQLRLLLRLAAAAAAALALKSFVVDPLTGHFGGSYDDFGEYLRTARSIAAGGDPYKYFSAATPVSAAFALPPFAALLVRPLAPLRDATALSLWLVLSLAATLAGALVVARATLPRSWPRVELAVLAALAFAPATYNYWHGQINGLIFLLLALGLWAYVSGRQTTAGVVLGLAAGIKLAPVVLLLLLLRRRWWRAAGAMVATGVATLLIGLGVLGIGPTHAFFTTVLPTLNHPTGWIYNQSLSGALSRVFEQSVLLLQPVPEALQVACLAAGVAVLAAALWVGRGGGRSRPERGAEFGLAVVAMLLAGSLSEFAHYTALIIPLFAACGVIAARGWSAQRGLFAAAVASTVMFGFVSSETIALLASPRFSFAALSHTPWWWLFLQACSLPCFAAGWFALELRRSLTSRSGSAPGAT
jgi:alpha-1,2-mannosyltransferase